MNGPPGEATTVARPIRRDPPPRHSVGLDAAGARLVLRALLFAGSAARAGTT